MSDPLEEIRLTLRCPFRPSVLGRLAEADGYLEYVWPSLRASVETAGFLGSALYMGDMALDTVEEVYEPLLTVDALRAYGVSAVDLKQIGSVVDVFHYVQPQLLLLLAALAEAFGRDRVGGQGRVEPRPVTRREQRHMETAVVLASPEVDVLFAVREALGLDETPDLYRAMAVWPRYLEAAWGELQHLVTYPEFRRRGRGLYYYARSGARFLAEPLAGNPAALRAAGLSDSSIETARTALEAAVPALAMMVMHAEAMRIGLGVHDREVVKS